MDTNNQSAVLTQLPQLNLQHFFTLCDDTGMYQHAAYSVPNRNEGYCTDDVARAIVFLCRNPVTRSDPQAMRTLSICISFLHYANRPDGTFHNFLSFNRMWLDDIGSEDSQGRALWSVGTACNAEVLSEPSRYAMQEVFKRSARHLANFRSPRSRSFGMLGCSAANNLEPARDMLKAGGDFLVKLFNNTNRDGWCWFEPYLTYCNARLPQSMYLAYNVLKKAEYLDVAEQSMQFLIKVMFDGEVLDVPGNHAWFESGGSKSPFDQQPVEAGSMVEALVCAYKVTGNREYYNKARQALEWYHGRNRLSLPLVDTVTGACCDGLMPSGVNRNQGAEAVLSYLLARTDFDSVEMTKG